MTVQNAAQAMAVAGGGTTETVVLTLPPIAEVIAAGGGVLIHGYMNITLGTSATAAVIRVRQGTTTGGTLVGVADTHTIAAASSPVSIPFAQMFYPQPGLVAMPALNQFCVTVAQTAATANGTINNVVAWFDAVSATG